MGFIASLPFLLKAIVGPVGGVIADLLRYKYMSTANVRRLFYAIGKFHPFTPHPFTLQRYGESSNPRAIALAGRFSPPHLTIGSPSPANNSRFPPALDGSATTGHTSLGDWNSQTFGQTTAENPTGDR